MGEVAVGQYWKFQPYGEGYSIWKIVSISIATDTCSIMCVKEDIDEGFVNYMYTIVAISFFNEPKWELLQYKSEPFKSFFDRLK